MSPRPEASYGRGRGRARSSPGGGRGRPPRAVQCVWSRCSSAAVSSRIARGKLNPKPGEMVLAQPGSRGVRGSRMLGLAETRARRGRRAALGGPASARGFGRAWRTRHASRDPGAAERRPARRDLRELRRSPSTRPPRATSTMPSRPSATATECGCGSISRTCRLTCGPAARLTPRPRAGRPASTSRERWSRCCPGALGRGMQPRPRRGPAGGHRRDPARRRPAQPRSASFYRSRIRSDARLDYEQLDEIFAGRAQAPTDVAEPLALARRAAATLGRAAAGRRARDRVVRAGVRVRLRRRGGRAPAASLRPRRTA